MRSSEVPVAIVAMACHLPGAANLEEYWRMLEQGGCAIEEVPPELLDRATLYDPRPGQVGKTYTTRAALLNRRVPEPARLGLTAQQAAPYEVAHLMLAEVVHEALSQLGEPARICPPETGVYVGATTGSPAGANAIFSTLVADYADDLKNLQELSENQSQLLIKEVVSEVRARFGVPNDGQPRQWRNFMAAGLLQQLYGLRGPAMIMDAACASSLQATLQAVRALQQGQIQMAIVGGASCYRPDRLVLFSYAQSVSARGSSPFDSEADGLIVGEGYATIILKRLDQARADGDPIRAVLRGIGMSTDGRGKSLWAPRREGQLLAMERAYPADLDLQSLGYLEAHATSTQVGDATELLALHNRFAGRQGAPLWVGSCKGNLGHCLETAGLAGLIKAVLVMEKGRIPPSPGIQNPNPCLDWTRTPLALPRESQPWSGPDDQPRRVAVNSFGVGGLNVHAVLEEHRPEQHFPVWEPGQPEPVAVIGQGCLFPQAHHPEALWELICTGASGLTGGGGYVRDFKFDWRKHKIPPRQLAEANPLQFLLLDAVQQALNQAGYDRRPLERSRVGVVVGTVFGGDFQHQLLMALRLPDFQAILVQKLMEQGWSESLATDLAEAYRSRFLEKYKALTDETGSFSNSTLASRITKHFDFKGGALALDAGDDSSLPALRCALNLLRGGDCDLVVCAGAQRWMDRFAYEEFASKGLTARGLVPGEGAGVLLLKNLSAARRDGDQILALIHGVAQKQIPAEPSELTPAPDLVQQIGHCGAAAAQAQLQAAVLACQHGCEGLKVETSRGLCAPGQVLLGPDPAGLTRTKPRVAWTFVGQGSQYAGMLEALVREFEPAARALEQAEEALRACACPSFAEMAWRPDSGLGSDILATQLSTLVTDVVMARSLEALGLRPDVVVGHSFGEIAALVVAGAWDLETAIQCVQLRTESLSQLEQKGGMIAISAGLAEVQEVLRQAQPRGRLYLSNANAPRQFTLSGENEALDEALRLALQAGLRAVRLNVPCAFHCPMMEPAQRYFQARMERLPLRPARVPLLSTAFPRTIVEVDELTRSLVEQFCEPVRYQEMIRKLAQDHPTVFVEVGPQRVLSKLHARILESELLGALACDEQPGLSPLLEIREWLRRQGLVAGLDSTTNSTVAPGVVYRFDASARRRRRNRGGAEADGDLDIADFLVQFVVEQTGYPVEMVDLDADLEGELGIDSIKKAQLFGEVRERFVLATPPTALSLDLFTTLRSILEFLEQSGASLAQGPVRSLTRRPMLRQVLRLEPSPLPQTRIQPGKVFLSGEGGLAQVLGQALPTQGWELVNQPGLANYLVLLDNAPEAGFQTCQSWLNSLLERNQPGLLMAVTRLGGDLGLSGQTDSPQGGALAGLVKSVMREQPARVVSRVVDFPAASPPAWVAERLCQELSSGSQQTEVAWSDQRYQLRQVACPVRRGQRRPSPGETWLVSGGGRGITARTALELAKRYDLNLQILGRSPEADSDSWQAYQQAGVKASYHCCDVGDAEQVRKLIQSLGPIRGVIHGAGIESSGQFLGKQLEQLRATLAPKVLGAMNLMAALEDHSLEYFLAFGSVSGRFGGFGQSDYSMANEYLSKLVAAFGHRHADCRAICLAWPAWDEIGMAARAESRVVLEARNIAMMDPAEGCQHLLHELESEEADFEVVFYDHAHWADLTAPPALSVDRTGLDFLRAWTDCDDPEARPVAPEGWRAEGLWGQVDPLCLRPHRNLALLANGNGKLRLDPGRDRFLQDHLVYGRPVLPGVVSAEALLEMADRIEPCQRLSNLVWQARLEVREPLELSLSQQSGQFQLLTREGQPVASATPVPGLRSGPRWDLPGPSRAWRPFQYPESGLVYHGRSLQSLQEWSLEGDQGWARLRAPQPEGLAPGSWLLPAAVLDGCLLALGVHAFIDQSGRLELPQSMQSLTCYSQPESGETCLLHFNLLARDERGSQWNFRLQGSDGRALLEVEGYQSVRLKQGRSE